MKLSDRQSLYEYGARVGGNNEEAIRLAVVGSELGEELVV
jgi:hypothetical protein